MAIGTALLVGLTEINSISHPDWDGKDGCGQCELDVRNIQNILEPLGFEVLPLKTEEATAERVLHSLHFNSERLRPGDIFVFYFSGHGGQLDDNDHDGEWDNQDETFVLYNRDIIDDELNPIWLSFQEGVRIVMLSESCHSGTNYKAIEPVNPPPAYRPMKNEVAAQMKAQLIHMGACGDGEWSYGLLDGSFFTNALCKAWDRGGFNGTYEKFHKRIVSLMPDTPTPQNPQYRKYGPVTREFERQKPFTI